MAEFIEVLREEELPPGRGTWVTVPGKDVALFNVDGRSMRLRIPVSIRDRRCEPARWTGRSSRFAATGWRYDVTTGSTLQVPGYGVSTFPIKIVDGRIMVAAG